VCAVALTKTKDRFWKAREEQRARVKVLLLEGRALARQHRQQTDLIYLAADDARARVKAMR